MAWEFRHTLFGPEIINTAPKCAIKGCGKYADNAGYNRYHKLCTSHHKGKYNMAGWDYKNERKDYCENVDGRLGFKCTSTILDTSWQLDVDHIDGDNSNNDIENLQTLCKCCHAYKTMVNEENLPMHKRKKYVEKLYEVDLRNGELK